MNISNSVLLYSLKKKRNCISINITNIHKFFETISLIKLYTIMLLSYNDTHNSYEYIYN